MKIKQEAQRSLTKARDDFRNMHCSVLSSSCMLFCEILESKAFKQLK